MDARLLLLALSAGLLAALNPCGFALLPAYLGLLVRDDPGRHVRALTRALTAAAGMTLGFVAVFGGFGLLVVPLALSVERFLPWVTLVVGLLLVALGVVLLAGREVGLRLPRPAWAPSGSALSWPAYGVAYALASLSCTAGPFLALTTSTFRTTNLAQGVAVFVAYALGMGALVAALSVVVVLARGGVVRRLRASTRLVSRISGALVLLVGAYVAWYGWYEVRILSGGATGDPIVDAVISLQETVLGWIAAVGADRLARVLLLGLVVLVVATALAVRLRRARATAPGPDGTGAGTETGAAPTGTTRGTTGT